ncbi:MAG: PhoH family protein [Calditrichae bacterium]|nr:PhoH family protein [Calditrichia bacterium]
MLNNPNVELLKNDDQRIIYVLDTNVLLHDPSAIFRFDEHIVLISLLAIEEIDAKKNDPGIGYNARDISNKLEQLIDRTEILEQGILIPNGKKGTLFFISGLLSKNFPAELSLSYKDNAMLSQIIGLKEKYSNRSFILVTKDRNLRIKAQALGIDSEDYLHDKISEEYLSSFFQPLKQIMLEEDEINKIFKSKNEGEWTVQYRKKWQLNENEGVALFDPSNNLFGLGLRKTDRLRYHDYFSTKVLDTYPKVLNQEQFQHNFEQAVCMAQALDDDIRIQIIIGRAGTGKTHIAMAAALEKVFKERRYDSIKLIKPIVTKSRLGEDIGFLPGSVKRKLIPKMRPFIDKLRQFTNTNDTEEGWKKLLDSGVIEMMNLADVRGADLANSFVIFDEAQNANPFQMRTLGTRLGEDTKLIVLGDPTQIDSIYLDKYSNALINLYENSLKNPTSFIAHICLVQMVRSHTSKWFEETMKRPEQH